MGQRIWNTGSGIKWTYYRIFLFSVKLRAAIGLQHSLSDLQLDQLTFLYRCILHRQGDEFLVGGQDGPLRLRLLPLHLPVELAALSPGPELFYRHLFEVKALFEIASEIFQIWETQPSYSLCFSTEQALILCFHCSKCAVIIFSDYEQKVKMLFWTNRNNFKFSYYSKLA